MTQKTTSEKFLESFAPNMECNGSPCANWALLESRLQAVQSSQKTPEEVHGGKRTQATTKASRESDLPKLGGACLVA